MTRTNAYVISPQCWMICMIYPWELPPNYKESIQIQIRNNEKGSEQKYQWYFIAIADRVVRYTSSVVKAGSLISCISSLRLNMDFSSRGKYYFSINDTTSISWHWSQLNTNNWSIYVKLMINFWAMNWVVSGLLITIMCVSHQCMCRVHTEWPHGVMRTKWWIW